MTLAYCTNIWSHHQGCVCRELAKVMGPDDFKMVMFQPIDCDWSQERIRMGWNLTPPDERWVVGPPKTSEALRNGNYNDYIESADVAVIGISPYMSDVAIRRRMATGKLTFIMGERYFKEERRWWHYLSLCHWKRWVYLHRLLNRKNVHFLTMNHWCADDLKFLRACKGRTWRWAYQTPVSANPPKKRDNELVRIGWCGRMFDWKQTILIIQAIVRLSEADQTKCRVEIFGNGDMEVALHKAVRKLKLEDKVIFGPMMPHDKLIKWLGEIDIYAFVSNRKEGWGATLIEAMDQGCAVVANTEAGATLDVVEDGVSGLTFSGEDVGALARQFSRLINDRRLRESLGLAAWRAVKDVSPSEGAAHLLQLTHGLFNDDQARAPVFGLCSLIR